MSVGDVAASCLWYLPSTSRAGAEYVGNLMYCAGELWRQMMGNDGLSVRCTRILEHSSEMSKRVNWTWSWSEVRANPRRVSHTIIVLSSLPDTAVVPFWMGKQRKVLFSMREPLPTEPSLPSADTLTHVTGPKCPANVWISSPVCKSQTIKLQSFEPEMTWLLFVTETATVATASEWPTSTFFRRRKKEESWGARMNAKISCRSPPEPICRLLPATPSATCHAIPW